MNSELSYQKPIYNLNGRRTSVTECTCWPF